MNRNHAELFINVAKVLKLNIEYEELENGDIIIQSKDKINIYEAYKEVLADQILNKKDIVELYRKKTKHLAKNDLNNLLQIDEMYKHKLELLDLQIEFISKDDYVHHYEGRIKLSEEVNKAEDEEANENIEKMVTTAINGMPTIDTPLSKNQAQIYGLIMRYKKGKKEQSEIRFIYKQLKNLLRDVT